MAKNKIDRINAEIEKTRAKLSEYQAKLKDLEAQKTEAENLQIVSMVRSMCLTPEELAAFIKGGAAPAANTPAASDDGADQYDEQEGFADEE